jgi:hypothetical protein
MFVSQQVQLWMRPAVAQARLIMLAARDELGSAARTAYEHGAEQLIRVGPLGHAPGSSKLVRALFLDPVYRDNTVTIGMRWEATSISDRLFPVLDANLLVEPAAGDTATLALEGTYRAQFGEFGANLDRALLNKVATATVRMMLRDVAGVLALRSEDDVPKEWPGNGKNPGEPQDGQSVSTLTRGTFGPDAWRSRRARWR